MLLNIYILKKGYDSMFLILVPLSILFAFWLSFVIRTTNQSRKKELDSFWEREINANSSRSDGTSLDYIQVPLNKLPFHETTDPELCEIQCKIKELSKKQIINLTGLSNTDIKYKYGVAKFNHMVECDQNFTLLSRNLYKWGTYLYKKENYWEAQTVLEYAVACKVDISGVYTTLANIYIKQGYPSKIQHLKEQVNNLDTLMKESIQKSLNDFHFTNS